LEQQIISFITEKKIRKQYISFLYETFKIIFLVIQEVQIKTTLTPVKIATIKNTMNNKCWQGCGEKDSSYTVSGNVIQYNPYGKQYDSFLKKLNIDLPYDPAIPLLRIYPK
jgi:hypothetical protein